MKTALAILMGHIVSDETRAKISATKRAKRLGLVGSPMFNLR